MIRIFAVDLVRDHHTRSFRLDHIPGAGWIAKVWSDHESMQQTHFTEWHRAERTLRTFAREIAELTTQGWLRTDVAAAS